MNDSNSRDVVIRLAGDSDWESVLALIVELADYERARSEVTLSVTQLQRDAERGCFSCHVAEAQGTVVGMVLHHPRYSTWKGLTWYIEDLVVTESLRGQGIGRMLFDAVVARAIHEKAERLEWQVLDWNEPAIGFYQNIGASLSSEWLNGRLTRTDMLNLQDPQS